MIEYHGLELNIPLADLEALLRGEKVALLPIPPEVRLESVWSPSRQDETVQLSFRPRPPLTEDEQDIADARASLAEAEVTGTRPLAEFAAEQGL